MKFKKIALVFMLIIAVICCLNSVQALNIDEIFEQAKDFTSAGSDGEIGTRLSAFILGDVMNFVSLIGNLIFAAVTVILGAKYIWSGVNGKADVKETLPTFIVGVIFFYLATQITAFFSPTESGSVGNILMGSGSYNTLAGTVLGTINAVVKVVSFAGLVFIGLKYLFASAEGKSSVKEKMVPVALGMLLVFSASAIVDFIIKAGNEII